MTPREALERMAGSGLKQPEILKLISGQGVSTTQATISRIASGFVKNPNYELGQAIVAAHDKHFANGIHGEDDTPRAAAG